METRTRASRRSSVSEEEVAAAISAILAGQLALPAGTTPLAAVNALLGALPDAPDGPVRDAAARLVLGDPPTLPKGTGAVRQAYLDNLLYRAWYAINAAKRLGAGDDLRDALGREAHYLSQHREATRRRVAGARATEAMVELHGPVLSWNHGAKGQPEEPRPHHKAADGGNFDLRRGIPVSTGALPGVEPFCTCAWGPPKRGARMMR